MNLQEILDYINLLANKDQRGRTFTPDKYNTALQGVVIKYFKWRYGLPEEYQPGMPLPRISWEITQKITDDLRMCKVLLDGIHNPLAQVNSQGIYTLPTNYIHYASIGYWYQLIEIGQAPQVVEIDVVTEGEWNSRISDAIEAPGKDFLNPPICKFNASDIQFWPKDIQFASFSYLRLPLTPVYDYYYSEAEQPIYLPPGTSHTLTGTEVGSAGQIAPTVVTSNTVELEFPADTHIDIATLLYQIMAQNLKDPMMYQAAEREKNEGK